MRLDPPKHCLKLIFQGVCPVLCSGHGQYGGGLCHCEEGWKGAECDIPESDCRVADCSGHGQCLQGTCHCKPGWKGEACDEKDCEDPTCSDHGACVQGQCYCKAGWQGQHCHLIDEQVHKCLPSCSDHGAYDLETGKCICNRHWTGPDCSQGECRGFGPPNRIRLEDSFQPFVTWIADLTADVIPESVVAIRVGPDLAANSCPAIPDVKNTDSAGMERVSVRRGGTDATARYVRASLLFYIRKSSRCKL